MAERRTDSKMLRHAHSGFAGRTIIQRLEEQMDKRRKIVQRIQDDHSLSEKYGELVLNVGRYEGIAAAIALMRNSNLSVEFSRSDERIEAET